MTAPSTSAPNIFNIRSFNDFVAMLYVAVPLITAALVAYGALSDDNAALWVAVGTGACQLVLQFARTQVFARKAIYTVLNLANMVLIAYVAGWNPDLLTNLMPILTVVLGGVPASVAAQNVNTTGDEGYGRHAAKVE